MTARLHTIYVDDREPDYVATQRLIASYGAPCEVKRLPSGDFRWAVERDEMQVVVVERKTVADLIASLKDERLFGFLDRTEGMLSILLVEGDTMDYKHYRYGSWQPEHMDNMLLSLQMAGAMIARSHNLTATPRRVYDLWRWSGNDHTTLSRPARPQTARKYKDKARRDRVRFLMSLPGVGEKTANKLLDESATVWEALEKAQGMKRVGEFFAV